MQTVRLHCLIDVLINQYASIIDISISVGVAFFVVVAAETDLRLLESQDVQIPH